MSKIKMYDYNFQFNPKMSPEEFVNLNEWYYCKIREDKHPEKAYKINDWDLEEVYDDLDYELVAELMTQLYREFLIDNYWY